MGADGDHVDCYLGPDEKSDRVDVIDQFDLHTGKFDEHKVMLGFPDRATALRCYERGFSDGRGRERIGRVQTVGLDSFRHIVTAKLARRKTLARAAGGPVASHPLSWSPSYFGGMHRSPDHAAEAFMDDLERLSLAMKHQDAVAAGLPVPAHT